MLDAPVAQDAGGELVVWVARPAQHHLHHLFAWPVTEHGTGGEGCLVKEQESRQWLVVAEFWKVGRKAGSPQQVGPFLVFQLHLSNFNHAHLWHDPKHVSSEVNPTVFYRAFCMVSPIESELEGTVIV